MANTSIIPTEQIDHAILRIRGQNVMLDRDLAALYGVATKVLNQAVRRNAARFPDDFMFQLSKEEFDIWRSQIVTSNSSAKMGLRRRPYAFTEQGVAMLSSVLNSDRAIDVNIAIMRAFVSLRELLSSNKELARARSEVRRKISHRVRRHSAAHGPAARNGEKKAHRLRRRLSSSASARTTFRRRIWSGSA